MVSKLTAIFRQYWILSSTFLFTRFVPSKRAGLCSPDCWLSKIIRQSRSQVVQHALLVHYSEQFLPINQTPRDGFACRITNLKLFKSGRRQSGQSSRKRNSPSHSAL